MTDDEVKGEMEEEMVARYEEAGVPKGERMVHRVPVTDERRRGMGDTEVTRLQAALEEWREERGLIEARLGLLGGGTGLPLHVEVARAIDEERALADRLAEVLKMTAILRCADLMHRLADCGICPPCEARAALAAHAERRKE